MDAGRVVAAVVAVLAGLVAVAQHRAGDNPGNAGMVAVVAALVAVIGPAVWS